MMGPKYSCSADENTSKKYRVTKKVFLVRIFLFKYAAAHSGNKSFFCNKITYPEISLRYQLFFFK